jgi:hypothetical protein
MPRRTIPLSKGGLMKERTSGVLTEVGRGQKGSIFVKGEAEIHARKIGRTLGGLQIWEIEYQKDLYSPVERKVVYLKNRKELRKVIEGMV